MHLIWPRWRLAEVSLKLVVSKAVNIGVFVAAHLEMKQTFLRAVMSCLIVFELI